MQRILTLVVGLLLCGLVPQIALADLRLDTGTPFVTGTQQTSIHPHVQDLAKHIADADCSELLQLDTKTKSMILMSLLFLPQEESLSVVIGPNCMMFGEPQRIARIDDNTLTTSTEREALYYLPDFDIVFVSDTEHRSIAYGMPIEDGGYAPLTQFLLKRSSAENTAAMAKRLRTSSPPPAPSPQPPTPSPQPPTPIPYSPPPTVTEPEEPDLPVVLPLKPQPLPTVVPEESSGAFSAVLITMVMIVIGGAIALYLRRKQA